MLKRIAELWRDSKIMQDTVQKLGQMVIDSQYVYDQAWLACRGDVDVDEIRDGLCKRDHAVNRGEREIRRMLLEHLDIRPGHDASGCLAVMIMAKDAERVGDNAGNIYTLAERVGKDLREMVLFDLLDQIGRHIGELFPKVEKAIVTSEEDLAQEILRDYQRAKQEIKDVMDSLFTTRVAGPEAVAMTLMTRYLMRINAHMGNVASGVIFPLDSIDFITWGLKQQQQKHG